MKAIAVFPKQPDSVHLADLDKPSVDSVAGGRGVLVRVLKVGVDATDREINEGKYGAPPEGYPFLVLGHECYGVVEEVGPNVRQIKVGDFVTATVRRPGPTIYDHIGTNDMTSHHEYYERGINLRHGYLTEHFVDDEEFIVKMPVGLRHLHVLVEPMSCAVKAVQQAFEAQRRLKVWRPKLAFVMGAGQIGLLTTLILRLRGLNVCTIARAEPPSLKSEIVDGFGATYVSTKRTTLHDLAASVGQPDLIVEATGDSETAFRAMEVLGRNGVLVWASVTGGDKKTTVLSDKINLEWVLGNKLLVGSVNGNRWHFEKGIRDLALAEAMFPHVVERILTTPIQGLENYRQMMDTLAGPAPPLKVFVEVAPG